MVCLSVACLSLATLSLTGCQSSKPFWNGWNPLGNSEVVKLKAQTSTDEYKIAFLDPRQKSTEATVRVAGAEVDGSPQVSNAGFLQEEEKSEPPETDRFLIEDESSDNAQEPDSSDLTEPAPSGSLLRDSSDVDGSTNQDDDDSIIEVVPNPNQGDDSDRQSKNENETENIPPRNPITVEQVLSSVRDCYPEIRIAFAEIEAARGKQLAALGSFDQVLSGHSISQPLGFYQTYRNGVGISQPLYSGGEVYSTYRIGDGNFEPWFGERETNEGGEIKAGFDIPLLKDRDIDKRRAVLATSQLQREQVERNVNARLLFFQRIATQFYWDWVATGQAVRIQQRLLALAEERVGQIKIQVEKGEKPRIANIDNTRLIAKRKTDLIKARRALEKTAIKLSLFWRDTTCNPVIPEQENLPIDFPEPISITEGQLASDIDQALGIRPELAELQAARNEACVNLQYANNLLLPKVNVKGFAGQDLGGAASSTGDKTPFELQVGVLGEVPIQRREGLGKIREAEGKIAQIDSKIQFTSDKIRVEIQDAASAVSAAIDQIEQSMENLELTRQSLRLGRVLFDEGDIDLLALNIYESAVADAELQVLDAQFKYFFYRAIYETAISGEAGILAP